MRTETTKEKSNKSGTKQARFGCCLVFRHLPCKLRNSPMSVWSCFTKVSRITAECMHTVFSFAFDCRTEFHSSCSVDKCPNCHGSQPQPTCEKKRGYPKKSSASVLCVFTRDCFEKKKLLKACESRLSGWEGCKNRSILTKLPCCPPRFMLAAKHGDPVCQWAPHTQQRTLFRFVLCQT